MRGVLIATTILCLGPAVAESGSLKEITYVSSADGTRQPAMFYAPDARGPVPLVVALHTWSGNYRQRSHQEIADWCMSKGWAYIHPDFRGPNRRPEATGSELVVHDIVDAVQFAKGAARIDSSCIFLVGTSGGGYTALLMAGRHPEIWAGVSAWVPISDLRAWYVQAPRKYRNDMAASCGGAPGDSPAVDEQYRKRSPLTYLAAAKRVPLHINAGITDGHTGSVPVSHSLLAFNRVAAPENRLSDEEIRYFVEKAAVPPHLRRHIVDPSYGEKRPLFRRTSGNVTVTIFNGGHELVPRAAIAWIEAVYKSKKGKPSSSRAAGEQ